MKIWGEGRIYETGRIFSPTRTTVGLLDRDHSYSSEIYPKKIQQNIAKSTDSASFPNVMPKNSILLEFSEHHSRVFSVSFFLEIGRL